MKKLICIVLVLVALMSLASCDLDTTPLNDGLGSIIGATTQTYGLNQTAKLKTLSFTATQIRMSNGNTYFKPDSGNVYVGIQFTIENTSNEEQSISSILLFDAYVDDYKYTESFEAAVIFDSEMLDGTIMPGKKLVGWYTLEVPSNWAKIELHVKSEWLSENSAKFVFSQ